LLGREHLSVYSASPDDDVFKTFSKDYADRHPTMQKPDVCGAGFKDGITNGADWYDLVGRCPLPTNYSLFVGAHMEEETKRQKTVS